MQILENKKLEEKIYYTKLHSNMKVFVLKKPQISKKYAIFGTNYGSNDLEYINPHTGKKISLNHGIAHFLEHKMFEMPDGSDAFGEFSRLGADANAFTSFNFTGYLFSTTNEENFPKALKHLITYVQTPHFTDENVEKEKGIIAQEIKMYDDNPSWQLFFNCLRGMYKTHPNSIDIAGDVESIYKITKEQLYDCYQTFYSPSNMALFVAGDVDENEVLKIVNETVQDKNMFDGEIDRIYKDETDKIAKKTTIKEMEVSIPSLMIGFKEKSATLKALKNTLRREISMELVNQIIFEEGSDLNKNLYEGGLIFSPISSDYTIAKDYGYDMISVSTKEIKKIEDLIYQEISKFKENGINKEDFERVKKKKIGTHIKFFDDIESVADQYIQMHFKSQDLFDYYDTLNSITIEELNDLIVDIFDMDMSATSIIKPKTKF